MGAGRGDTACVALSLLVAGCVAAGTVVAGLLLLLLSVVLLVLLSVVGGAGSSSSSVSGWYSVLSSLAGLDTTYT